MGQKKKIKRLLDALQGVFKGAEYRKELKRAEVFQDLVERLETRRDAVCDALEDANLAAAERATLRHKLAIIDQELPRAARLLEDLRRAADSTSGG